MNLLKLTISEAAELLGVTAKTIRHYHAVGLLEEPQRDVNGYRLYTPAEMRQLQAIRHLQSYGLTLRQIQFILHSGDPDTDLQRFLIQRDAELNAQIDHLQRQQARIRSVLNGTEFTASPAVSTRAVVDIVLRPAASGLTDVLLNVEGAALDELDCYLQTTAHIDFWETAVSLMSRRLLPHQHELILWLERYLALADLTADDRQAQAWLSELPTSSVVPILSSMLALPCISLLSADEHAHLQRMLTMLLYDHAAPLQRIFLATLATQGNRQVLK